MRRIVTITLIVAVFTGVGLWVMVIRGCWLASQSQSSDVRATPINNADKADNESRR